MDGQAAAIEVVRLVAKKVKKLGVHECCHKIEGAVRVRKDNEQRRFPVAQGIQLQFVLRHKVPQFLDVKGREAGAAANQDGFQSFSPKRVVKDFLIKFTKKLQFCGFTGSEFYQFSLIFSLVLCIIKVGKSLLSIFQKGGAKSC